MMFWPRRLCYLFDILHVHIPGKINDIRGSSSTLVSISSNRVIIPSCSRYTTPWWTRAKSFNSSSTLSWKIEQNIPIPTRFCNQVGSCLHTVLQSMVSLTAIEFVHKGISSQDSDLKLVLWRKEKQQKLMRFAQAFLLSRQDNQHRIGDGVLDCRKVKVPHMLTLKSV